jgi:hypothetical protein
VANDSVHFVSVGDAALRQELIPPGGGNIPGWYDAPSSVRASNHKTPSNSWQDATNSARIASGKFPIVIELTQQALKRCLFNMPYQVA